MSMLTKLIGLHTSILTQPLSHNHNINVDIQNSTYTVNDCMHNTNAHTSTHTCAHACKHTHTHHTHTSSYFPRCELRMARLVYCLATSGWLAPRSYRGSWNRTNNNHACPTNLWHSLVNGTYSLPDLEGLLTEWLCCLEVTTFAIEHGEVVEGGGHSRVVVAMQLLTDLQCIMEHLCCLLQLPLLPVCVCVCVCVHVCVQ